MIPAGVSGLDEASKTPVRRSFSHRLPDWCGPILNGASLLLMPFRLTNHESATEAPLGKNDLKWGLRPFISFSPQSQLICVSCDVTVLVSEKGKSDLIFLSGLVQVIRDVRRSN